MRVSISKVEGQVFSGSDYSLHVLNDSKGEKRELHTHSDCDESWVIVKGKYEITIDGEDFVAEVGDLVTVERQVVHSIEALEDSNTRLAIFKDGTTIDYVD
jgi:mannose-6-phosphate isomerase-like protein (cupin superfamily)